MRGDHFGQVREALAGRDGQEAKTTGDGLLATFTSAGDALAAAVAIQQGTALHLLSDDCPLIGYDGVMDLGRPASVAVPAGTEAVLRVLAGSDAPLGVREVARLAGVSANRASQVLSEFAAHGLVLVDEHGAGRLCRLNTAHLATDSLLALVGLRARLLDFLRSEITSWPRRPVHASLFGSAARGDGTTSSDLDLLVIRPDIHPEDEDDVWEEQLFASGERIFAATGNRAAWFVTTPVDLRRAVEAEEPIIGEWRRDAIHLAGRRLGALLREAA